MARARILKPGFFNNELLAELPFEGRLLFAGLWTLADREGRLEDRPKRIQAAVFPFDAVDVDGLLAALESKGFVERYIVGAAAFIQIAKFTEHQTPHHREPASSIPPPPSSAGEILGQAVPGPSVTGIRNTVDGNGSVSAERSSPPFLEFPVVGKGSALWGLTEYQVEEWQGLYPNLDVSEEMRKALAWAQANPGRRKTARGMPAFLVNWLSRATDRRVVDGRREKPRPDLGRRRREWNCQHEPRCPHEYACEIVSLRKVAS